METSLLKKSRLALCMAGIAVAALAFGACALKDSTSGDDSGTGLVISVKDTAKVKLDFSDMAKTVFIDSGTFNLVEIRSKLKDKGINPDSVQITGIEVRYSDSAKVFLDANKDIKFVLKVYIRENGTGEKKLTLETPAVDAGAAKVLAFDPAMTLFQLNKHIFGNEDGFPGLLSAIRDTTKLSVRCIAELALQSPLKTAGNLRLNMVVTVAGKN